jgi:hypothetical protein
MKLSRKIRPTSREEVSSVIEEFLSQPPYVEDEELERNHVHNEPMDGERRVNEAIAHALGNRQQHGGGLP